MTLTNNHARPSVCGRKPAGMPNPVDVHVGARVRLRRALLGLSQEKLGEAIDITFQQIQKYERSASRIGASRLFDFSCVLDMPASFFFEDIDKAAVTAPAGGMDRMAKRETLELVRAYYRIPEAQRRQLFALAKSMAHPDDCRFPSINGHTLKSVEDISLRETRRGPPKWPARPP